MAPRYDEPDEADPGTCREGLVALRDAMLDRFDGLAYGAGTASGCYIDGGTTDSGNRSFHAVGRAVDLAGTGKTLDDAFDYVVAHADELDAIEVIANGRIWTARHPSVRPYTANPHDNHIHIALNLDGAARGSVSIDSPEDFMAALPEKDQREILAAVRTLIAYNDERGKPPTKPTDPPHYGEALRNRDLHAFVSELKGALGATAAAPFAWVANVGNIVKAAAKTLGG